MRIPVFPQVAEVYWGSAGHPTSGKSDKTGLWNRGMFPQILIAAALLAPVSPSHIVQAFQAPTTVYGRGHRGVDFGAEVRQPVVSPLDGIVSFVGRVNDRSVISIRSGALVVSLEPVDASVGVGAAVHAGAPIGITGVGGHCSLRCVHMGLRINGVYTNPLSSRRRLLRY